MDGVLTYLQTHGRGFIDRVLKGEGKYRDLIGGAMRNQGLPQDLIYLAAGESAFNPLAAGKPVVGCGKRGVLARCVGIWQFALETGELYGLKKDRWVDERESNPIDGAAPFYNVYRCRDGGFR